MVTSSDSSMNSYIPGDNLIASTSSTVEQEDPQSMSSDSLSRPPRTLNPRRESRKPLFECECALCHSHPLPRRSNSGSPSSGNQRKQVDTSLLLFPDSDHSSDFDNNIPLIPDGLSMKKSCSIINNLQSAQPPPPPSRSYTKLDAADLKIPLVSTKANLSIDSTKDLDSPVKEI